MPLRQPRPSRTRTLGFASKLHTQPAWRPCWAISHSVSPSGEHTIGVCRSAPVRRPTVSTSAIPGGVIPSLNIARIIGFAV